MEYKSARLFSCTACKGQSIICSCCDRGNIYCQPCALLARAKSKKAAAKRYQKSRKGRLKHAQRQQAYRQRQKQKVTHHGSLDLTPCDVLPTIPKMLLAIEKTTAIKIKPILTCDFCGNCCDKFLRVDFLYSKKITLASFWPSVP